MADQGTASLRTSRVVSSSFRDPSGFVFQEGDKLYRQVNAVYKDSYEHLLNSGLYENLTGRGLLVPHEEATLDPPKPDIAYKVIRPEPIDFVSYPYEWCFSQLKDAALTLLTIQKTSLEFGMTLKDCSAYNVQFTDGRPVLIDTLSFEKHREGYPWVAYRQFCQHFLAPLALMAYRDVRLNRLLQTYIDGVPLDLTSSLLPARTRLSFSLLWHIHLHARSQKRFAGRKVRADRYRMGRLSLLGVINSLESATKKLKWQPRGTDWIDYYEDTNYSREAFECKKRTVAGFLDRIAPANVWDLGANVGVFSRLASERGIPIVSLDVDPAAVERSYLDCIGRQEDHLLPLVLDLTNPSPGIGWGSEERMSLVDRGPADTVIALALLHHLAIGNNTPFDKIAGFLSRIGKRLIVEFVPKSDSQVQRLLSTRDDIFGDYTQEAFEREFGQHFTIQESVPLTDSVRVLYMMERKNA